MSSTQRWEWLDALRGIAIVAVVAMHVTWAWTLVAPPDSTATAWLAFVHLLASFGVPLFLLVSARALLQGYHAALGGLRGWVAFVARRAQRLLPAYLAWSLLSLAAHDTSLLTSPIDLAGTLLLGGAEIHFYFVPLVFQLYLLWPIFARAGRLSSKSTTATVLFTVGATLLMIACWRVTPAWNHSPPLLQLLLSSWLAWPLLGCTVLPLLERRLLAGEAASRRRPVATVGFAISLVAVLLAAALVAWQWHPGMTINYLGIVVMVFSPLNALYFLLALTAAILLVTSAPRAGSALAWLGRRSYGIYLCHLLVMGSLVFKRILGNPVPSDFESPLWIASWAAGLLLTLALSAGLVEILRRVRLLARFVGYQ